MKKHIQLIILSFLLAGMATAQEFVTPLSSLSGDALAETNDGKTIEGRISMATMGMKGLMSFRIKEESTGIAHKFKAEDVKSLRIRIDAMGKMETLSQQTSNITRASKANFNEYREREFIYYHQVEWPEKPGKYMLVQLLNEGWDSKIKVYDFPSKKTATTSVGGFAIAGNEAKSFVVDYMGSTNIVDRRNYKSDHFPKMFGSCDQLSAFDDKQSSFSDFAVHVFIFETECN